MFPRLSPKFFTEMPPIPTAAAEESETHTETCKEFRAKYSRHAKSYVPTGVDAETRLFNRLKRDKHADWIEYCKCNCKGAGKGLLNLFSRLLFDWDYCYLLFSLLVLLEVLLGALIILKRPYTKIDWDAYMDEVAADCCIQLTVDTSQNEAAGSHSTADLALSLSKFS